MVIAAPINEKIGIKIKFRMTFSARIETEIFIRSFLSSFAIKISARRVERYIRGRAKAKIIRAAEPEIKSGLLKKRIISSEKMKHEMEIGIAEKIIIKIDFSTIDATLGLSLEIFSEMEGFRAEEKYEPMNAETSKTL